MVEHAALGAIPTSADARVDTAVAHAGTIARAFRADYALGPAASPRRVAARARRTRAHSALTHRRAQCTRTAW